MSHPTRGGILISTALHAPKEIDLKRKGHQKGSIRKAHGAWYIAFREWRTDAAGHLEYALTERKIGPAYGPGALTKRQAEQVGYERFVLPANGLAACPQGIATLRQFVEARYTPDVMYLKKRSTRIMQESLLQTHILPSLGDIQMRDITAAMVQTLISGKLAAGYSTQTAKHLKNLLANIFRHAKRLKFHTGDLPTDDVLMPTVTHKQRRAATVDQLERLTAVLDPAAADVIWFLARTGLRRSELLGLTWAVVNLSGQWVEVDGIGINPWAMLIRQGHVRGEYETPKTRKSYRTVPLSIHAAQILMRIRERSEFTGPDDPVFASQNGTPADLHNMMARKVKPAARKLGMPWFSLHCLRHTTATLTDSALTPAQKSALLGHASQAMSLQYTHPELEQIRRSLNALETHRKPQPKILRQQDEQQPNQASGPERSENVGRPH